MSLYTEVRGNDGDSYHGDNLLYVGHNCAYTARQIKKCLRPRERSQAQASIQMPGGIEDYIYSISLILPDVKKNARIYRA